MITLSIIIFLLVVLAIGVPIAFATSIAGAVGLYFLGGWQWVLAMTGTTVMSAGGNYELLVIPMFVLMGEFIVVSRMADELFDAAAIWAGRAPGGLAIATVGGGTLFGAISGSSAAAAVTLSATSLPAMVDRGYSRRFAGGVVVVTATLDMLIPPSIPLVFYGLMADVSISQLLIGGLVPGVIIALVITAYIISVAIIRPNIAPAQRSYSWSEKFASLRRPWAIMLLFLVITVCLYTGIVTPTETSAFGAFTAMCLAMGTGRLTWSNLLPCLTKAARTSCMIAFILIGSYLFTYFFTLTRSTVTMVDWVLGLDVSRYVVLLILGLIYLFLGTFLDTVAMMILTVPIVLPIIKGIGYDPVWYGIMLVIAAQLGILTPPTGMHVFIVAKYANAPAHEIFAGVAPYIVLILAVMVIFTVWPELILWLPNYLK